MEILLKTLLENWFIAPLLVVAVVLKSPWFKGLFGEVLVNIAIKFRLNKEEYRLFKNITLPTKDGTTQIDHILVSKYGVFVIETKNMKGWIFGSEHQKQWTQKIFKHSSKFQNPLHQNYKHTKTLAECLDIPESYIYSVVVFVGDSTFKTKMPPNVTYAGGLFDYIKSKAEVVLTPSDVESSILKIESGRLKPSLKTHREHIKHVRSIQEQKASVKTCFKCGSPMVQRISKKGINAGKKFWGCSAYPKCRAMTAA